MYPYNIRRVQYSQDLDPGDLSVLFFIFSEQNSGKTDF
jgi:hypothetical protein